jgi:hypothetical protein
MFKKLFNCFLSANTNNTNKSVSRKTGMMKSRHLQLETLEPRELLSVNPLTYPYQNTDTEICVLPVMEQNEVAAAAQSTEFIPQAAPPAELNETFSLHSKADSHFTIYLDFNGHVTTGTSWNTNFNDGNDIETPAYSTDDDPNFSNTELERIQYIWQRVAEDFIPFDVDVTTEEPDIERLKKTGTDDTDWGIRVVIGGNSDWYGNAGGVAYLRSFSAVTDTPCFVFAKEFLGYEKEVAEAISHEVGHTLGLSHDGTNTQGDDSYYSGANGWAPIMGVGYNQPLVQWSKGEYNDANEHQDDLAIITGNNGFTYRNDDHGDTFASATLLTQDNAYGIIEQNTDIDFFQFELTTETTVDLSIISGTRDANLDVLAYLYSSENTLLYTANPNTLSASFSTMTLVAGIYYLSIEGTGKEGVYSDYGSLGYYTITVAKNIASTVVTTDQDIVNKSDGNCLF